MWRFLKPPLHISRIKIVFAIRGSAKLLFCYCNYNVYAWITENDYLAWPLLWWWS